MLSTLGTLNGSILTNPRVFFAMAADGFCSGRSRPCIRATRRRTWRSRWRRCSGSSSCCCERSSSSPTLSSRRSCRFTRWASRRSSCSAGARRVQAAVPRAALSVRADSVRAGDDLSARQCADRSEQPVADARGLRRHPARHSGVLHDGGPNAARRDRVIAGGGAVAGRLTRRSSG